jgi:hypothetical protein
MRTLRLTETELKRLVRKVISEQSLPKDMEFFDYQGKKYLLANMGAPCSLSEITKEYEKMKKFIISLPNGKVVGDLELEADHNHIGLSQKFASSMSIKDLEDKYDK